MGKGIKSFRTKLVCVVVAAIIQSLTLFAASLASKGPLRGQFPECQEKCLSRHTDKMHTIAEKYKKTDDKLQYQDDVEKQSIEYESCLENCRQIYPVK